MNLKQYSDRELLESIYLLLVQAVGKLNRIDDDSKEFFINVVADLFSDKLQINRNGHTSIQKQDATV